MPKILWTSAAQNLIVFCASTLMHLFSGSIFYMTHILNLRFSLVRGGSSRRPAKPICSTKNFLNSQKSEMMAWTFCTDVRDVGAGPLLLSSSVGMLALRWDPDDDMGFF
jgi:hypothetical protein